ncbi:uncharacterized protein LOC124926600 [Impatiens glandulifera]|uniref:uncharacterized protein LOC124926600 n=1 Tax=Impatiens glandulifera TaxID=253017 RepID=UPI001FB0A653|nr:uncharacterized protein LOC124926600 [Impatiens glandulifera]
MVPQRSIESCTLKLQSWSPFRLSKTLDSDSPKPCYSSSTNGANNNNNNNYSKRPCRADRATSFTIDAIDMSRLSLIDDDRTVSSHNKRWFARKRRRRGSRSVSGRSSDRSGNRRRCCSVGASAAYGTCSDIPVTVAGTDSSGELFLNGDLNWGSDVSEANAAAAAAARNNHHNNHNNSSGEKENSSLGHGQMENNQGNESGYGSEPGYRGDAEFGYGDEFDEEEDDQQRVLFWGHHPESNVEMVAGGDQNTLQKAHHRCRRKKQSDVRMVDSLA